MNDASHGARLAVGIVVLAGIDLTTKRWAIGALSDGPIVLPGPVDLQLHYNSGTAFGLFASVPSLVIAAATVAVAVVMLNKWRTAQAPAVPVALIVAGGLANTIDRLEAGSVVDMLHTGWWPTFNLADTYITIGVAIWAITAIFQVEPDTHDELHEVRR